MAKLENCIDAVKSLADSIAKINERCDSIMAKRADAGTLEEYKAVRSPKMLGRYHMREANRHSENLTGFRAPEEECNTHAASWHAKAAHHFMQAHHMEGSEKDLHLKHGREAATMAEKHSAKVKEFEKLRSAS